MTLTNIVGGRVVPGLQQRLRFYAEALAAAAAPLAANLEPDQLVSAQPLVTVVASFNHPVKASSFTTAHLDISNGAAVAFRALLPVPSSLYADMFEVDVEATAEGAVTVAVAAHTATTYQDATLGAPASTTFYYDPTPLTVYLLVAPAALSKSWISITGTGW